MFDVKDGDYFDTEEELFESVLERGVYFRGNVRTKESLLVRGVIEGGVEIGADLVVDECGAVMADVRAGRILVKGELKGDVTARGTVFVSKRGKVTGNITASSVILEPGSVFVGKCNKIEEEAMTNV